MGNLQILHLIFFCIPIFLILSLTFLKIATNYNIRHALFGEVNELFLKKIFSNGFPR